MVVTLQVEVVILRTLPPSIVRIAYVPSTEIITPYALDDNKAFVPIPSVTPPTPVGEPATKVTAKVDMSIRRIIRF